MRELVHELGPRYGFFSILATDCGGTNFEVLPKERRVGESMWTERGFVVRATADGRVAEASLDVLPSSKELAAILDTLLAEKSRIECLQADLAEIEDRASWYPPSAIDPLTLPANTVLDRLDALRQRAVAVSPLVVSARTRAEWVRTSKLYLSSRRELEQSYLWGQAYVIVTVRRGEKTKQVFDAVSGLGGLELLDSLESRPEVTVADAVDLLGAVAMEGGEYTVVLSPDMAGILAHEAFGHGVETDMFVKGRAKAAEYLGKRVGSPLVTMYDGAASADQNGSFLFDDEGTRGSSTLVLDKGILVSGISDLLSARELGVRATGNGRRWSFSRKAYARMTNTFFTAGSSKKEELIAGVPYGWLLERSNSGMEDPKNWGIQLVALVGREIRDGKLTGKIASPVICTGFVPDVLGAVDAVSDRVELMGNGYCGKGYKEFVKVSSGSPWLRTKMRLG
jgi:TldD protein